MKKIKIKISNPPTLFEKEESQLYRTTIPTYKSGWNSTNSRKVDPDFEVFGLILTIFGTNF